MSNQYRQVVFSSTSRPLIGLDRQPLKNSDGSVVGNVATSGVILQWMDPEQYAAQVQYARTQLTAAVRNRDPVAMQNAAKAIMAAYNDANIPWEIDPQARFLYQRWIAGAPTQPSLQPEFGAGRGQRYNDDVWLAPDPGRCIIVPGSSGNTYGGCISDNTTGVANSLTPFPFTGVYPLVARNRFSAWENAASPIQYLPRLQFVLRVPDESSALAQQFHVARNPVVPLPFDIALLSAPTVFNDVIWRTEPKQHYRYADGSDASGDPDGWDVSAYDTGAVAPNVPEQFRLSYADYATYLSSWISSLETRSAEELVQDARAYALYRNARTQEAAGGNLSTLAGGAVSSEMLANVNALNTANPTVANDLHIVAASAAAVGAAFAPVTLGISGLIGGVVAATLALTAAVLPADLSNVYIDDLERPKPWISRSWLGGSPSNQTMSGGPPAISGIPDPPGWIRPPSPRVQSLSPALLAQLRAAGIQTPAPPFGGDVGQLLASVPAPVWIGAGLVIGAAALYAGSRLTQGRGSSARRTSTRRSRSRR